MSENGAAVQGDWVSRAEIYKIIERVVVGLRGERAYDGAVIGLQRVKYELQSLAAPVSGQGHDELDWRDFYDRAAKIANSYHAMLEMKHGELVAALPLLQNSIDLLAAPVLGGDK